MTLRKRFANAGNIRVTDEDLAKAASMQPSTPKTAPGQMMQMQGLLQSAEDEIRSLKEQLKDAAASAEIPLDLIDEVEGRRRKLSPEAYLELTDNLRKNPLGQPITVRKKVDGRYELVAGHNRKAVFKDLDRKTIPAFVIEVDDAHVEMVAFYSNLLSPSLSDFEKYWNFKKLSLLSGLTHAAIAESAGISRSHVTRIMQFDGLPEKAKELLSEKPDRLGVNAALKLIKLTQDGHGQAVTEAVGKLIADDAITQDQAIALASPQASKAPTAPVTKETVKIGKQTFCDISIRNNVIGVRFAKTVSDDDAKVWAKKFAEFMKAEIDKRS